MEGIKEDRDDSPQIYPEESELRTERRKRVHDYFEVEIDHNT